MTYDFRQLKDIRPILKLRGVIAQDPISPLQMELIVIKNSAKPDNKLFWSCLILFDFFTLFQTICPALQSNELNVLRVSKMTLQRDDHSYTPWKSQRNFCFSDVFRRYRNGNAVPVSLLFAIHSAYKPSKSLVDFKQVHAGWITF